MTSFNFTVESTILNKSDINPAGRFTQANWIVPVCINLLLIILTLWSMVSLSYYGKKTGKWKNNQKNRKDELGVGMVYTSVITCTIACLSYLIATQIYINVGYDNNEDALCNIVGDIANFTYGFVLLSVYMFLWTRQRVFYKTHMLSVDYGRVVQCFSSASIVIIAVAGICVMVFLILPYNHKSSFDGCLYNPDDYLRIGYWVSVFVVGAFGQTTLLYLFVYALKQSRGDKWQSDSICICSEIFTDMFSTFSGSIASSDLDEESNVRSGTTSLNTIGKANLPSTKWKIQQSKSVRWILYKTVIFALISTACDLFFQIYVHYGASSAHNRRIDATIGSVCAFLNLLFRILSFAKYKEMLMPFCRNFSNGKY